MLCCLASAWLQLVDPYRRGSPLITEDLLGSFQRFAFSELDEVPETPGLYAWYGLMKLGAGTWRRQIEKGVDAGEVNSRRALQIHTERFTGAPLEVSVDSAFASAWSGTLQDDSFVSMKRTLEYLEDVSMLESDRVAAPKLQAVMNSASMRELAFNTLSRSAPVFSSPLYIGVAVDLRKRLRRHSHNLQAHRLNSAGNVNYFDNVTEAKTRGSFAFRAAQQGFSPDNLEVWVLNISEFAEEGATIEDQRTVAEACEWLLNRWHRPQLGRR